MCGGWTEASERSWLVDGPSPSTVLVPAQSKSRRLAAKACWAAWVGMADQRERREASTAWRRMSGAALAFVWASKRRKVVASWLHRPPLSRAKTTSMSFPWICVRPGVLLLCIGRHVGGVDWRRSEDTKVVSTASCAPPHNGSPLAITSILLSSCRAMCSKLRSLSRVLVVTLAPASRQTLAAARSKGTPRPRSLKCSRCVL